MQQYICIGKGKGSVRLSIPKLINSQDSQKRPWMEMKKAS